LHPIFFQRPTCFMTQAQKLGWEFFSSYLLALHITLLEKKCDLKLVYIAYVILKTHYDCLFIKTLWYHYPLNAIGVPFSIRITLF